MMGSNMENSALFDIHMARMKPHNRFYRDCFSAGYYYRLSDEDKNKTDRLRESASITTQREMISYAVDSGMVKGVRFYKEYYDDDYTGLNFDRPAFLEMMRDVEENRIDCIIVKDFSRFGRNSDRVKQFLEADFERQGREIRFIALGDNYDSLYKTPDTGVRLLLFMNEEYSQNQHLKVSLAIRTKQAKGDFIGAFSRYGYMKDPANKNHLIPDPYPFLIVKRIFRLAYDENMGASEIAALLTDEGISPPAVYKREQGSRYRCSNRIDTVKLWNPDTVSQILQDRTYTGAVVQGKRRKETLLGKPKAVSREVYTVVPDMHEAAVSPEIFDDLQRRRKSPGGRVTRNRSIFQGIVRCGDCRHAMIKRSENYISKSGEKKSYVSYCCRIHKRESKLCYPNTVRETVLSRIVTDDFNRAVEAVGDLEGTVNMYKNTEIFREQKKRIASQINRKREELGETEALLDAAQRKWLLGSVTDEQYKELQEKYSSESENIKKKLRILYGSLDTAGADETHPWIRRLLKAGRITELSREIVSEMIDAIYIFHDNTIRVIYKFSDESAPPRPVNGSDTGGSDGYDMGSGMGAAHGAE